MRAIDTSEPLDMTFAWQPQPSLPQVGDIVEIELAPGEVHKARVETVDADTGDVTLKGVAP